MGRAHRARGSILVAVMAVGLLAPLAALSSAAASLPRVVGACANHGLRATITTSMTAPNGRSAGLALAETNVSAGTCTMTSPFVIQLETSHGGRVGGAVSTPSFVGSGRVRPTYQGTFDVSVRSGGCARPSHAEVVRVTSGPATSIARLRVPVAVCPAASHPVTVSPVAFLHPAPCAAGPIAAQVGWPNGAAGTIAYSIVFLNPGHTACTVHGIPSVQALAQNGEPVGPAASMERVAARGGAMVIGVNDGVDAWSLYSVVETGNFPPARCGPADATAIRATLPGYAPTTLHLDISVCTKLASTSVEGVAPRWLTY